MSGRIDPSPLRSRHSGLRSESSDRPQAAAHAHSSSRQQRGGCSMGWEAKRTSRLLRHESSQSRWTETSDSHSMDCARATNRSKSVSPRKPSNASTPMPKHAAVRAVHSTNFGRSFSAARLRNRLASTRETRPARCSPSAMDWSALSAMVHSQLDGQMQLFIRKIEVSTEKRMQRTAAGWRFGGGRVC